MNREELIQFEDEIGELYLEGQIKSPVHLSKGNEDQLIEIFKMVKPDDWVFSTHRSHIPALLKGIDPGWLKAEILANRSIHINNAEHKFFTSAIVGGICPIALGVALAIKRKGEIRQVWCIVGDMAAETGIFHECTKYAARNDLPITFVVEDNSYSVNSPTQEVWGNRNQHDTKIIRFSYERGYPHHGVGKWVNF